MLRLQARRLFLATRGDVLRRLRRPRRRRELSGEPLHLARRTRRRVPRLHTVLVGSRSLRRELPAEPHELALRPLGARRRRLRGGGRLRRGRCRDDVQRRRRRRNAWRARRLDAVGRRRVARRRRLESLHEKIALHGRQARRLRSLLRGFTRLAPAVLVGALRGHSVPMRLHAPQSLVERPPGRALPRARTSRGGRRDTGDTGGARVFLPLVQQRRGAARRRRDAVQRLRELRRRAHRVRGLRRGLTVVVAAQAPRGLRRRASGARPRERLETPHERAALALQPHVRRHRPDASSTSAG